MPKAFSDQDELGETDYVESMGILTDLIAGYITGGAA